MQEGLPYGYPTLIINELRKERTMHIFDTRIQALDYMVKEGDFYQALRIERAVVPSGEYYIVTEDIGDIDDVYWTYEGGLDFAGAKGFGYSRLYESYENIVKGTQLEYHFPDLGEVSDDSDSYAFRVEWHIVYDMDQDVPEDDNIAGWCMTLHDVSE